VLFSFFPPFPVSHARFGRSSCTVPRLTRTAGCLFLLGFLVLLLAMAGLQSGIDIIPSLVGILILLFAFFFVPRTIFRTVIGLDLKVLWCSLFSPLRRFSSCGLNTSSLGIPFLPLEFSPPSPSLLQSAGSCCGQISDVASINFSRATHSSLRGIHVPFLSFLRDSP